MSAQVIRTVRELRSYLDTQRRSGLRVAAVPTMGALHEGHLSLIREAANRAEVVVVTIFVNPTQFGPGEDFERYPRTLESDTRLAESAGANVIFAPEVKEMYPEGEQTRVRVPGLSQGMCGASRPTHFEGVATIVAKIFHVVGEAVYCFGRKDYQQLRVIERLAIDLLFPVEIVGCPIVREVDGLAMSSRNVYLSAEQRVRALAIVRTLQAALDSFRVTKPSVLALIEQTTGALSSAGLEVDYVEIRDALSLEECVGTEPVESPAVLAVAVRLGNTRLIDNVVLTSSSPDLIQGGAL